MSAYFSPFWVVTSYYNPAGYKRRLQNFKNFRRHLNVPLAVVELARPGHHQLSEADGDIVLRLVGEDRIWQKERLLNIGVKELPRHVEYVAWVDCDVVFEDEDWAGKAKKRLERQGGVLQLFETSVHLPRDLDAASLSRRICKEASPLLTGMSVVNAVRSDVFDKNEAKLAAARAASGDGAYYPTIDRHNCYGLAWSAPRSLIEECGLYDGNIIGGGNSVQVFAMLSRLDDYWKLRAYAPKHREYALSWTQKAASAGWFSRIDSLDQRLFHMWHGDIASRNYRGRYNILARHDFDPSMDIAVAENGTWRWTDPQGALARDVGAYLLSRREDGAE